MSESVLHVHNGVEGTKFINSLPELYQLQGADTRRLNILGGVEGSETYAADREQAVEHIRRIADGQVSPEHQKLMQKEATLLGIAEIEGQEETFLDAHRNLMHTVTEVWEEKIERWKAALPGAVAEDLGTPTDYNEIKATLEARLADTRRAIHDPYLTPVEGLGTAAQSLNGSREVAVGGGIMIELLSTGKDLQDPAIQDFLDANAQHELGHQLTAQVGYQRQTPDARVNLIASTGLSVATDEGPAHGAMLDEGALEYWRRKKFQTTFFTYDTIVAAVAGAVAVDPSLGPALLRAAVFHEGRGQVIGGIEAVYGPTFIDELGERAAMADSNVKSIDEMTDYNGFMRDYCTQLGERLSPQDRSIAQPAFDEITEATRIKLEQFGMN